MKREPIAIINSIVAFIGALLPVLVAFGVFEFTKEQTGALNSAIAAWGGVMATLLGRTLVTPVADPRDNEGRPLKP